jgi:hypothetical protein
MSENLLEKAIRRRIQEWEDHMQDARYFGDSHYVLRCDSTLTLLKNILAEGIR